MCVKTDYKIGILLFIFTMLSQIIALLLEQCIRNCVFNRDRKNGDRQA